ncbi:hypothetical protein ACLOJK_015499 [Asimina triloba]
MCSTAESARVLFSATDGAAYFTHWEPRGRHPLAHSRREGEERERESRQEPSFPLAASSAREVQCRRRTEEAEQRVRNGRPGMGGNLYALDFDGVLCDSCGESSLSALKVSPFPFSISFLQLEFPLTLAFHSFFLNCGKAAKIRWPGLFDGVDSATEQWIVDQMFVVMEVRPVVETGYENLLLVRLLLEIRLPSIRKSSVADGLTIDGILENWSKIKPIIMEEWNENRDALVDLFGKVRDEWIEKDLSSWIGANRFYPGIADALRFASSKLFIVTTKQAKGRSIEAAPTATRTQGIEASLMYTVSVPPLGGSVIAVVITTFGRNWGYNTQKEREDAASIPRIQILDLSDFSQKLK